MLLLFTQKASSFAHGPSFSYGLFIAWIMECGIERYEVIVCLIMHYLGICTMYDLTV